MNTRTLLGIISLFVWTDAALFSHQAHAAKVFPIATDPTIVEISGSVLFDGTNYVAGYFSDTNVSLQRFAVTGDLLDQRVDLGAYAGFPPAAAFASSRAQHLAAWTGTNSSGVTIFGQLISRVGVPLNSSFPLLQNPGAHGLQTVRGVASDGTNFLVVWVDANEKLFGQLVTSSGTLDGAEFMLSGPDQEVDFAAVAFGRINYLVAWQGHEPMQLHQTFGAIVSRSGSGDSPFLISESLSPRFNPLAVGFDGTNFLAIWNHDTSNGFPEPSAWDLLGRVVSPDGAVVSDELVLVGDASNEINPSVAFDGSHYLLAWTDNLFGGGNIGIRFQFLDWSGSPVGSSFQVFTNQGTNAPLATFNGVAFDGTRFVVAATLGTVRTNATGRVIGFNSGDVYGAFIPKSSVLQPTRYKVIKDFTSGDAKYPNAGLVLDGNTLYGTTIQGGISDQGTVFSVNTDGSGFTLLKEFSNVQINGGAPLAGMVLSGNTLCGTTYSGGPADYGTVFKINTDGLGFTNLKFFNGNDGALPSAGLVLEGNTLYGTTRNGGSHDYGTVFKVNIDGTGFKVIREFVGHPTDGALPIAALVLSGNALYGTTYQGGSSDNGTVFKLNTDGMDYTVLKEFGGSPADGDHPIAGLVLSDNMLLGTTLGGGNSGYGTVFRVNTDGTGDEVVKHFTGFDGRRPQGNLTLSGNMLFGTTEKGGSSDDGTLFQMNANGNDHLVLKHFNNRDGIHPYGDILASGNMLFGTTLEGGDSGLGTVFRFELGGLTSAPELKFQLLNDLLVLAWDDPAYCLQSALEVVGPWTTIPGASSPHSIVAAEPKRFFRLIGD